jgi:hyaluronan synthase
MLPWMLAHAPLLATFFLADIALPFLLLGATIGWIYRAATDTGINFYAAMLAAYGVQSGVLRVIALALVATMLSVGVRQLRHLSERPGDFLRLPVFIALSTLFLMPIRLIGFFRMAHVSGWGTRANGYAGLASGTGSAPARTAALTAPAPAAVPAVPAAAVPAATVPGATVPGATVPAAAVPAVPGVRRNGGDPAGSRPPPLWSRWLNPLAAIPYLIGITIIVLEVLHHA